MLMLFLMNRVTNKIQLLLSILFGNLLLQLVILSSARKCCSSSFSCTMEKESFDEKKNTVNPVSHEEDTSVNVESPVVKEDAPDIQALNLGKVSISEKEVL